MNRFGQSAAELSAKAKNYKSMSEAQSWMNIVLLDGFISEVVGDEWQSDDPSVATLLSIFERAWSYQVRALYPAASFTIERLAMMKAGIWVSGSYLVVRSGCVLTETANG